MEEYWHAILEALIDTARMLPILFIVYYLIELLEFKYAFKIQNSKWLKGKASPVFGAVVGCIPQCGFSVISTDLYTKRAISVGALIAVYLATSDEAIPLMIMDYKYIPWMLAMIGIKIVMGIVVGYLANYLYKIIFKKSNVEVSQNKQELTDSHEEEHNHIHNELEDTHTNEIEGETKECKVEISEHGGCCHHHVSTKSFDWLHPLLHCLKISAFILVINILFTLITHVWIGEDALTSFLSNSRALQPLLALVIGLIPNCASSVVLTQLFISGGLTFGALITGLCVNAGLGLVVLFKQNKRVKENIFILTILVVSSLVVGYALNFI